MEQISQEQLDSNKEYFTFKRNSNLNRFNKAIQESKPLDVIQRRYENLIRSHKQWLLIDDAVTVFRFITDRSK